MGVCGIRSKDPTPEEIKERAEEIRRGWSKKEKHDRCVYDNSYRAPVVAPRDLHVVAPRVKLFIG